MNLSGGWCTLFNDLVQIVCKSVRLSPNCRMLGTCKLGVNGKSCKALVPCPSIWDDSYTTYMFSLFFELGQLSLKLDLSPSFFPSPPLCVTSLSRYLPTSFSLIETFIYSRGRVLGLAAPIKRPLQKAAQDKLKYSTTDRDEGHREASLDCMMGHMGRVRVTWVVLLNLILIKTARMCDRSKRSDKRKKLNKLQPDSRKQNFRTLHDDSY